LKVFSTFEDLAKSVGSHICNSGFGSLFLFSVKFKLYFYCQDQQIGSETTDNLGMRKISIGGINTLRLFMRATMALVLH